MKIRVSMYGRVLHLVDDLVLLRNQARLTRKDFCFQTKRFRDIETQCLRQAICT